MTQYLRHLQCQYCPTTYWLWTHFSWSEYGVCENCTLLAQLRE